MQLEDCVPVTDSWKFVGIAQFANMWESWQTQNGHLRLKGIQLRVTSAKYADRIDPTFRRGTAIANHEPSSKLSRVFLNTLQAISMDQHSVNPSQNKYSAAVAQSGYSCEM